MTQELQLPSFPGLAKENSYGMRMQLVDSHLSIPVRLILEKKKLTR
jgi:hypothetical protein